MDAGSEHDQFRIVSEGHASSVYALVPQPGAFELMRIKEDHRFLDFAVHHLEVNLQAQGCGKFEALDVVANVEAANDELACRILAHYRQDVNDRQLFCEVLAGVVQDAAYRSVGATHHPFHAVDSTEEVATVDADGAACADEDVLVVAGHADDFVGDYLADRENQVVAPVAEQFVHLRWPGVVELAFADVVDKTAWVLAQGN